jgi:hypothetical protein
MMHLPQLENVPTRYLTSYYNVPIQHSATKQHSVRPAQLEDPESVSILINHGCNSFFVSTKLALNSHSQIIVVN